MLSKMKPPKHFAREVRRARHFLGFINVDGRAHGECRVLDVSNHGAKVVVAIAAAVPDHFELAFSQAGQKRACTVIWRRIKTVGVRFT